MTDRGEAGYGKVISRRTETSYEADGMERAGTTQRSPVILANPRIRVSQLPASHVLEVNGAVGWRRFSFLPGEISTARDRESGSAVRSNALGDGREVSRGHSTAIEIRGAGIRPFKLGNPPARSGKDRTDTMGRPGHPSYTSTPNGSVLRVGIGAGQRKRARAKAPLFRKERRRTFVTSK